MTYEIDQPTGAGSGGDGKALDGAWVDHAITISGDPGMVEWEHTFRDRPPGSSSVMANASSRVASFTPDVAGDTYRVRLRERATATGAWVTTTKVIRVTKDADGATVNYGVCSQAFDEVPSESNYGSNVTGYAANERRNNAGTVAALDDLDGRVTDLELVPSIELSAATPQPLGTAAAGSTGEASDAGHAHEHGNQAGGSLHADVIAAGASGFMSGADKTKLDNAVSTATASRLAIRDGSGNCAFVGLTASSLSGGSALVVSASATCQTQAPAVSTVAPTSITHDTPSIVNRTSGGTSIRTTSVAASFAETYDAGVSGIEETWTQDASAAGGAWWRRGQKGVAGSIGGVVGLASGKGGIPGTQLAGGIRLELGQQVGGTTDTVSIREDSTEFLAVRRVGTTATLDASGSLRTTPASGTTYHDGALHFLAQGGAYSQIVSPRFTINQPTDPALVMDLLSPSGDGTIGVRQQLRLGGRGGGSDHPALLGLFGRSPVEPQPAHDLPSILRALTRLGLVEDSATNYSVTIFGDSLWKTLASSPLTRAERVLETHVPTAAIIPMAVPGAVATTPAHFYAPVYAGGPGKRIAICAYGANNIVGGQSDLTLRGHIAAEVTALLAAGYTEVILTTISRLGTLLVGAGPQAERTSHNAWRMANYASLGCSAIIDVDNIPNLTDPTNTTYFQEDQIHLKDAGHAALALGCAATINGRLTGQSLKNNYLRGDRVDVDATTVFDVDAATIDLTASTSLLASSGGSSIYLTPTFFQTAASLLIQHHDEYYLRGVTNGANRRITLIPADTVTTDATTTTAWSRATLAGTHYHVMVRMVASNDTDNESGSFECRRASFRNLGGTLTQIGAVTPAAPEDHLDTTIAAALVTIDLSGTSIRARVTGVAGKTIRWRPIVEIEEVAIA